ncbi:MAG: UvrD-helicase domain-containing protein [Brachymonas sp.]|nr:UvrD-helicase domain-containing protein [Brachymonas sp.]
MSAPIHTPLQPYRINGKPVTAEAFYAAACNPQRPVVVEACAGAGKTWMLVSRMVRALLEGAEPQNILAITFTNKAAAEMRHRLQEWLAAFAEKDVGVLAEELALRGVPREQAAVQAKDLQNLYLRLLQHGRPVQIRTFHGWFAALLRAAPLQLLEQLGLPADYELLEDDSAALQASWRPFHAAVLQDAEALADYQALVDAHGRSQTQAALLAALHRRSEFVLADQHGVVEASVPHFSVQFPEMQGLDKPANFLLKEANGRKCLLAAALVLGQAKQPSYSACGVRLEQALEQQDWEAVVLALLTQKQEPRKFNDALFNHPAVQEAQAAVLKVLNAEKQHAAWLHQQRMTRLTRLLCRTHAQVKRQQGWVDMEDIETAARLLLQDETLSGWLQERLDAQVRHVFIDEFQDTNPLQWQALHAWLQSYAGAGQGISVFIVGDPKQSIYRFRRAEPAVFRAARDFVCQGLQGDVLTCDQTRRNAQSVVDAANATMAAAQAEGRFADFRPHTTAAKTSGGVLALPQVMRPDKSTDAGNGMVKRRDHLTQAKSMPEDAMAARECRQAAAWLAPLLHAGFPAREVLVLARKNNRLVFMHEALAAHGIRSQLADKSLLADAPEVQDVVALVDALVSPRHDLSLARALKSPLFGASDAQLVEMAVALRTPTHADAVDGTRPTLSWLHWLLHHAPKDQGDWAAWADKLLRWQRWLQQWPPHDALSAIYQDGDVLARYAAAVPASQRHAVLQRLRALPAQALAQDGGRYPNAYAWVRAMRSGQGDNAPANLDADTVRLLTVHGAKGLEAALVLLIDTDGEADKAKGMEVVVDWPGEKPHPQQLVFLVSEKDAAPSLAHLLRHENAAREREEHNGFYVAMTRAKQWLVFSAAEPFRAQANSLWQQMQAAAQPDQAALDEAGCPLAPVEWVQALPAKEAIATPSADPENNHSTTLLVLPELPPELQRPAYATQTLLAAQDPQQQQRAAMGEAMHRALEWHRPGQAVNTPALQQALASQYQLSPDHIAQVLAKVEAMLQGEAAWIWQDDALLWQANEVDLAWEGAVYRIDRLVQRKAHGNQPATWWVLDYKSSLHPERQPGLADQLRLYRAVVQAQHPGNVVRAAFVTGEGKLVE